MKKFHPVRLFLTASLLVLSINCLNAQEYSAGVNINSPNPNAVLHLVSPFNNQGLLIPVLTTAQRRSMSLSAVDNGLLVFDGDLGLFYFWRDGISPLV